MENVRIWEKKISHFFTSKLSMRAIHLAQANSKPVNSLFWHFQFLIEMYPDNHWNSYNIHSPSSERAVVPSGLSLCVSYYACVCAYIRMSRFQSVTFSLALLLLLQSCQPCVLVTTYTFCARSTRPTSSQLLSDQIRLSTFGYSIQFGFWGAKIASGSVGKSDDYISECIYLPIEQARTHARRVVTKETLESGARRVKNSVGQRILGS